MRQCERHKLTETWRHELVKHDRMDDSLNSCIFITTFLAAESFRFFAAVSVSLSLSRSRFSRKQDRCSNLCARLVYHNAQSLHNVTKQTHTHTKPYTSAHTHTQLKFISPSYEMQLLFLSPSLSLSGGIHMDKRRGKWVFRAAITSSQGGNNNNHVLYEALCTAGPTGWLTRLASGIGGGPSFVKHAGEMNPSVVQQLRPLINLQSHLSVLLFWQHKKKTREKRKQLNFARC